MLTKRSTASPNMRRIRRSGPGTSPQRPRRGELSFRERRNRPRAECALRLAVQLGQGLAQIAEDGEVAVQVQLSKELGQWRR
jgi:hypothetical protein